MWILQTQVVANKLGFMLNMYSTTLKDLSMVNKWHKCVFIKVLAYFVFYYSIVLL